MQKIMKNWIFTMVTCILLLALALLLVLDMVGLFGEKNYATTFVSLLAAAVLIVYIVIGLAPMIGYYRGRALVFLIAEMVVMAVLALALLGVEYLDIFKDMQVGTVLGIAVWFRCSVLIVRAYLQQTVPQAEETPEEAKETAEQPAEKSEAEVDEKTAARAARRVAREKKKNARTPLWFLCSMILLSAVGVWQAVDPLKDKVIVYCIAGIAVIFATVFAVLTVQNRRALPKKPKAEKQPDEAQDALPAASETKELPAPTEEKKS